MAVTKYLWDEDNIVLESDDVGATLAEYTYEPEQYGNLISERRGGTTYQHHYDALGSTRLLTDEDGQVTDTFAYDAWGNAVERTGMTETPFQWAGETGSARSSSSQMYAIRYRTLSPGVGRWTSVDPLRTDEFSSEYLAMSNDPISIIDPSGETPLPSPTPGEIQRGKWALSLIEGPKLLEDSRPSFMFRWRGRLRRKDVPKLAYQSWLLTSITHTLYQTNPFAQDPKVRCTITKLPILYKKDVYGVPGTIDGYKNVRDLQALEPRRTSACAFVEETTVLGGFGDARSNIRRGIDKVATAAEVKVLKKPLRPFSFSFEYIYVNFDNCADCFGICEDAGFLGISSGVFEQIRLPWGEYHLDRR